MKKLSIGVLLAAGCAAAPPAKSEVAVAVAVAPTPPIAIEAPPAETNEKAHPAPTPASSCGLVATISKKADGNGYRLTLRNNGMQTLKLVDPGDGSEAGWRTPALAWSGTSGGKPATPLEGGRCGMMNRIEASELFTLAPGASRSIDQWIDGPAFAKGTYEVRLRYTNDPAKMSRKAGGAADVMASIEATSVCEVTSAPLTIQVP